MEAKCAFCGDTFIKSKYATKHKYCSRKCLRKTSKEYDAEYLRDWKKRNWDKHLKQSVKSGKKASRELGDTYVKQVLWRAGVKNPSEQIIELKRKQLKLLRYANNESRGIRTNS